MSTLELLVVVVGAPAGYWLVNFLLRGPGDAARAPGAARPDAASASPSPSRPVPPPPPAPPHWSEVLEVPRDADAEAIRDAYRRQVARYHPDKVASLGPELQAVAHRKTAEITEAYRDAIAERAGAGTGARPAGEGRP